MNWESLGDGRLGRWRHCRKKPQQCASCDGWILPGDQYLARVWASSGISGLKDERRECLDCAKKHPLLPSGADPAELDANPKQTMVVAGVGVAQTERRTQERKTEYADRGLAPEATRGTSPI